MVELENNTVPALSDMLTTWYHYVDDTIAFVKEGKIDDVVSVLNNYHEDIKFTHETEENCIIPFLDVSMQRTEEKTLRIFSKSLESLRILP